MSTKKLSNAKCRRLVRALFDDALKPELKETSKELDQLILNRVEAIEGDRLIKAVVAMDSVGIKCPTRYLERSSQIKLADERGRSYHMLFAPYADASTPYKVKGADKWYTLQSEIYIRSDKQYLCATGSYYYCEVTAEIDAHLKSFYRLIKTQQQILDDAWAVLMASPTVARLEENTNVFKPYMHVIEPAKNQSTALVPTEALCRLNTIKTPRSDAA